jgi:hypothetical protein
VKPIYRLATGLLDRKGMRAKETFTIKPGPKNPVELVWIGLMPKATASTVRLIHPKIGQTASHGCIRITNWDALHVVGLVGKRMDKGIFRLETALMESYACKKPHQKWLRAG